MIIDGLEFRGAGLSDDQLRAGLLAAHAEFTRSGVTPFEGISAQEMIHSVTDDFGVPWEEIDNIEEAPEGMGPPKVTAAHKTAYTAWDEAQAAALKAAGIPEPWKADGLTFRALPVDVMAAA